MKALPNRTDLPVLLPPEAALSVRRENEVAGGYAARVLTPKVGLALALLLAFSVCLAEAQAQGVAVSRTGVLETMIKWAPLMFQGFLFNILVSFMSMAIGTFA